MKTAVFYGDIFKSTNKNTNKRFCVSLFLNKSNVGYFLRVAVHVVSRISTSYAFDAPRLLIRGCTHSMDMTVPAYHATDFDAAPRFGPYGAVSLSNQVCVFHNLLTVGPLRPRTD